MITVYTIVTYLVDIQLYSSVRKAVKATLVLLPLLGLAHWLHIITPDPSNNNTLLLSAIVAHFLQGFEGAFIAIIYCFLNKEVSLRQQENTL